MLNNSRRRLLVGLLLFALPRCESLDRPVGPSGGDSDVSPADTRPAIKVCQGIMCESDADCSPSTYKGGCNKATGMCRMCTKAAHCDPKIFKGGCKASTGFCSMCTGDKDCYIAGIKIMTGRCDGTYGFCFGCEQDPECHFTGSPYKYCDTSTRRCVMCRTNADCAPGQGCEKNNCVSGMLCSTTMYCPPPLTCDEGVCGCSGAADCATAHKGDSTFKKWRCE